MPDVALNNFQLMDTEGLKDLPDTVITEMKNMFLDGGNIVPLGATDAGYGLGTADYEVNLNGYNLYRINGVWWIVKPDGTKLIIGRSLPNFNMTFESGNTYKCVSPDTAPVEGFLQSLYYTKNKVAGMRPLSETLPLFNYVCDVSELIKKAGGTPADGMAIGASDDTVYYTQDGFNSVVNMGSILSVPLTTTPGLWMQMYEGKTLSFFVTNILSIAPLDVQYSTYGVPHLMVNFLIKAKVKLFETINTHLECTNGGGTGDGLTINDQDVFIGAKIIAPTNNECMVYSRNTNTLVNIDGVLSGSAERVYGIAEFNVSVFIPVSALPSITAMTNFRFGYWFSSGTGINPYSGTTTIGSNFYTSFVKLYLAGSEDTPYPLYYGKDDGSDDRKIIPQTRNKINRVGCAFNINTGSDLWVICEPYGRIISNLPFSSNFSSFFENRGIAGKTTTAVDARIYIATNKGVVRLKRTGSASLLDVSIIGINATSISCDSTGMDVTYTDESGNIYHSVDGLDTIIKIADNSAVSKNGRYLLSTSRSYAKPLPAQFSMIRPNVYWGDGNKTRLVAVYGGRIMFVRTTAGVNTFLTYDASTGEKVYESPPCSGPFMQSQDQHHTIIQGVGYSSDLVNFSSIGISIPSQPTNSDWMDGINYRCGGMSGQITTPSFEQYFIGNDGYVYAFRKTGTGAACFVVKIDRNTGVETQVYYFTPATDNASIAYFYMDAVQQYCGFGVEARNAGTPYNTSSFYHYNSSTGIANIVVDSTTFTYTGAVIPIRCFLSKMAHAWVYWEKQETAIWSKYLTSSIYQLTGAPRRLYGLMLDRCPVIKDGTLGTLIVGLALVNYYYYVVTESNRNVPYEHYELPSVGGASFSFADYGIIWAAFSSALVITSPKSQLLAYSYASDGSSAFQATMTKASATEVSGTWTQGDGSFCNIDIMQNKLTWVCPIIDPLTFKQRAVFKDLTGKMWVTGEDGVLNSFFTEDYDTWINDMIFTNCLMTQYGGKIALANVTEIDVVSGNFCTSGDFTNTGSWVGTVTPASGAALSGMNTLLSGTLVYKLGEVCRIIFYAKGDVFSISGYSDMEYYANGWYKVSMPNSNTISLSASGTVYISNVSAYKSISHPSSVYISNTADYQNYTTGTGDIIEVVAPGDNITGLCNIEKRLYVLKADSLSCVDETGNLDSLYYVTENIVAHGGNFLRKTDMSFYVLGSANGKPQLYFFANGDLVRVNEFNQSGYSAAYMKGSEFDYTVDFEIAMLGDKNLLTQYAGGTWRGIILKDDKKVGNVNMGKLFAGTYDGVLCGIPARSVYVIISSTAGFGNRYKRLKKIKINDESYGTYTVSLYAPAIGPLAGSYAYGMNAQADRIQMQIQPDGSYPINQIVLTLEDTMPTRMK